MEKDEQVSGAALNPEALITNGWTLWSGGECPVAADMEVEVMCRDGYRTTELAEAFSASGWWAYKPSPYKKHGFGRQHTDIIAYRIVQP